MTRMSGQGAESGATLRGGRYGLDGDLQLAIASCSTSIRLWNGIHITGPRKFFEECEVFGTPIAASAWASAS